MPLSDETRARLEAAARQRGIDPAKLIAAAENQSETSTAPTAREGAATQGADEKPKLFMYLLPFVTVREVRQNWLGLSDSFAGDGEIASAWAAKQSGGSEPPPTE